MGLVYLPTYNFHLNQLNVDNYTIHGSYGNVLESRQQKGKGLGGLGSVLDFGLILALFRNHFDCRMVIFCIGLLHFFVCFLETHHEYRILYFQRI